MNKYGMTFTGEVENGCALFVVGGDNENPVPLSADEIQWKLQSIIEGATRPLSYSHRSPAANLNHLLQGLQALATDRRRMMLFWQEQAARMAVAGDVDKAGRYQDLSMQAAYTALSLKTAAARLRRDARAKEIHCLSPVSDGRQPTLHGRSPRAARACTILTFPPPR